ncbi:MAG TPA: SCO family protein [Gemmatimonadaceae bacterium]|jgi:protein SCO1/2|nr:SCO family protein [Gemmatimonadaceae bacterium]
MRLRILGTLLAGSLAMLAWRTSAVRAPALPFYADSTLTPVWTADTASLHRIGEFSLTDQNGHAVSQIDLNGRVTVVTFFYATCKDLCPRLQSRLAAVRAAFPDDPRLQLISISVAPEHDTREVLNAYAHANHIAAPDWLLLTGARAEIDRVARKSFFGTTPVSAASPATHGETIWLIDGSRRIRGLYNGTMPLDSKRLMEDIATLAGSRGG